MDEAFLSVELPDPVSRALVRADASIRAVGGRVAVRSSATAEDLHGTSFAGQYRSFLDVGDRAELERTVRLVWASLWYPSPTPTGATTASTRGTSRWR
ncbi:MAG: PEP/pyruvate-binding domain-containing protein [Microthrixaceae bacterium]|nr:PEP/pyruvate-binding domain-containing protein [Microthrixaceae bacterium]